MGDVVNLNKFRKRKAKDARTNAPRPTGACTAAPRRNARVTSSRSDS